MSQMNRGLLLRLSGSAVVKFAEEADQPDRDNQEAEDDPNQEYVRSGFGNGNNPDTKADNADRDQIRYCSVHGRSQVSCLFWGTVDR
jgi:hypothetical protein